MKKLERTTFEASREMEFFNEKELEMQIGHGREWWPVAVIKELVDNALDACETANIKPHIEVDIGKDVFSVRDNGPGLPEKTLIGSLDYLKRVTDKAVYISPTRGQLGNALKAVWAAPFVADGERGLVEVWTQGVHHTVEVTVDRIAQRPNVNHSAEASGFVKNGTFIKVHWPDSAGLLLDPQNDDSYKTPMTANELIEGYVAFNPHATFRISKAVYEATAVCSKWKPDEPTSAHWYTAQTLRDLIAAYVAAEKEGEQPKTVRAFVSEFRGLSGTTKQKEVTAGLSGVYLRDLVNGGDIDMAVVERLLESMRRVSKPPKPGALGVVGKEHLTAWLVRYGGASAESVRYVKRTGDGGMPHVIEVAFGIREDGEEGRRIVTGLNWSPTLKIASGILEDTIAEMRIDDHDPVTLVVHMARPRFEFTDHGKTRIQE